MDIIKVHRFECSKNHVFLMPMNLPVELEVFSETIGKVKCPLCYCDSKEIRMSAKEFTVTDQQQV